MPTPEERAAALVKDLSWWEVIALALLDTKDHKASVAEILSHPLLAAQVRKSSNNNPRAMIWASLQIHTKDECPNVKYTSRSQPLVFEKDESSIWSIDAALVDKEAPELNEILNGFNHPEKNGPPVAYRYRFTTFHQSFSYEDFIEGIKPQMGDAVGDGQNDQVTYEIKDGVLKEICREAEDNPTKKYALFIDEINRGNVASIFGELITLIEDDKRLGRKNQLTAVLPYSRKEFGVPDNLYIIGTMNTADRSVEALDTALRRRFIFEEMLPDREKVSLYPDAKVDLQKMFDVMNARIERLLDHDHCIGHAYFMCIENLDDLRSVFANKILPLLREYFYGSPAKVGMVLGDRFVLRKTKKRPFAPGSWGADELDEKEVFAFADVTKLTEADFATIYAEARPGI
jgi:5-methylcytosine-specific restriction endonuclease McrBC GTP-binding regulatory subunit McrB